MEVRRAIVAKGVIDRLIREKVALVCQAGDDVAPLPVQWRAADAHECNWEIPGWIGETAAVERCRARVAPYIRLLQSQFDISAPPHAM